MIYQIYFQNSHRKTQKEHQIITQFQNIFSITFVWINYHMVNVKVVWKKKKGGGNGAFYWHVCDTKSMLNMHLWCVQNFKVNCDLFFIHISFLGLNEIFTQNGLTETETSKKDLVNSNKKAILHNLKLLFCRKTFSILTS